MPAGAEEQSTEQSLEGPELSKLHHVTQSATIPEAISRSKHRSSCMSISDIEELFKDPKPGKGGRERNVRPWAQCGEVRRSWIQKAGSRGERQPAKPPWVLKQYVSSDHHIVMIFCLSELFTQVFAVVPLSGWTN